MGAWVSLYCCYHPTLFFLVSPLYYSKVVFVFFTFGKQKVRQDEIMPLTESTCIINPLVSIIDFIGEFIYV